MILNPNCSELVTHLGLISADKVLAALKKINNAVPGWKLGVCVPLKEKYQNEEHKTMFIPIGGYTEHLQIVENKEGRYIRVDTLGLMWSWAVELSKKPPTMFAHSSWDYDKAHQLRTKWLNRINITGNLFEPYLFKTDITEPVESKDEWYRFSGLSMTFGDGYCKLTDLTVSCSQHCATSEFPMFHEIRKLFGSGYHAHDGGSTENYESWKEKEKKKADRRVLRDIKRKAKRVNRKTKTKDVDAFVKVVKFWAYTPQSHKAHYFKEGTSLCGKHAWIVPLPKSAADAGSLLVDAQKCKKCLRKFNKRRNQ